MVYGSSLWSHDTVARLSVRPYPTIIVSPRLWMNVSTSGDTTAPAVGKILGRTRPNSFLTTANRVLSIALYFRVSSGDGRLPIALHSTLYLRPTSSAARKIFWCMGDALSILACIPAYTFSQNRGTADIAVG